MVAGNSASKGRIKSAIAAKTIVAASETANAMPGPVAVFLLNCLAQLDEHPLRGRCPSRTRRYSTTILESKDYLVSPVLRCDVREPRLMVAPLLRQAFPHGSDRVLTSHDAGAWRKCRSIVGIQRRDAGEIAFVEKIDPLRVYSLDLCLLRKRGGNQPSNESNHQ